MKKIIGIIAAVAMAASVFAAEGVSVSGYVKTNTSILNVGVGTGSVQLFKWSREGESATGSISVGGDKVGGSFNLKFHGASILVVDALWVQPIDQLKFTFGDSLSMFKKDYWQYGVLDAQTDFKIDIMPASGLTISLGLDAENAYYANFSNAFPIGKTAAKVAYAADFGALSAMYSLAGVADHSFAVGYDNTFGSVRLVTDAMLNLTTRLNKVLVDLYLNLSQDAFGFTLYSMLTLDGLSTAITPGVLVDAKVSYALDNFTPYATFVDKDVLSTAFDAKIKGGATWTFGSAAMDLGVEYNFGTNVIDVPLEIKLSF